MGMRIEETRSPSGAASEVIMKTLTDECGRFSVPIDVTEAAQKVGIEVKRLRLDDATDGLLVKDRPNRPFKAVVDSFSHEHRARFTLAHELGHYIHRYQDIPDGVVVGKVERRDTRSSLGIDGEEIWANRFAAALLMPAAVVAKYVGSGYGSKEIADLLDVPEQAVRNRIATLGLDAS